MVKITIITCTYNAESELEPTLSSVLCQQYGNVEHLILDGASTDRTLSIANDYKAQNDNADNGHEVKIVSEKDDGLYDAMNKGIEMATGDYLLFLNAGDRLPDADTLSLVAAEAVKDGQMAGVVYGFTDIVDQQGQFICHRRLAPPEHLSWRSFKWGMLVCHQAFYASTQLARHILYNKVYRFSADVDWCIRIMKAAEQQNMPLRRVDKVVAHFLDGGMTSANHKASLKERFRVMTVHYGLFSTITMHLIFIIRKVLKK